MRLRPLFADVSSNNGGLNLEAYRHAGHRLLAIKATEGNNYVNPLHGLEVREAHRLGIRVIHYHFVRPTLSHPPVLEAKLFHEIVAKRIAAGDLICLDIEVSGGLEVRELTAYVAALDQHVTDLFGFEAIGYTYTGFMDAYGGGLQVMSHLWWMANYGGHVHRLGHGRHRFAHQFTDGLAGGRPRAMRGIGRCDISRLMPYGMSHLHRVRPRVR